MTEEPTTIILARGSSSRALYCHTLSLLPLLSFEFVPSPPHEEEALLSRGGDTVQNVVQ